MKAAYPTKIILPLMLGTVFCLCSVPALSDPPEPAAGKRWAVNPGFSDEFNTTTLDRNKWYNYHPYWRGRPPAKFDPSTVLVANGSVQIKNKILETPDGVFTIAGGAIHAVREDAYHGYYEARFKASRINMSTTFWLSNRGIAVVSPNNQGTDCSSDHWSMELDIAEAVGGVIDPEWGEAFRTRQQYNTHVWYTDCNGSRRSFARGTNAAEGNGSEPADNILADNKEVWQDFNTYAAWWKNENEVDFYLNDKFAGRVQVSTDLYDKPYNRPMTMQMVTETYDWATPYPTVDQLNNDNINTSYYDWVRSYVLVGVSEENPELDRALIQNAGFENGGFTHWVGWGGNPREVVRRGSRTGDYSAHVVGAGATEYTVDLLTNTQYRLTAYANVLTGNLLLGAKANNTTGMPGFGATSQGNTAGQYQKVEFNFNTDNQTAVKLFMYAIQGSEFYLDDVALEQIDPPPTPVVTVPPDIFDDTLRLKSAKFVGDVLELGFIYKSNLNRDALIVVKNLTQTIAQEQVVLKAGYGHFLQSVNLSNTGSLTTPTVEINMMAIDSTDVLATTGVINLNPTNKANDVH